MGHVITFRSTEFDPAVEPPNPVNPIAGESVLRWLGAKLTEKGYTVTAPDAEDWGWYIDVGRDGAHYLVGASGDPEPEAAGSPIEWTVQIHRHRSLKDKVTGKNKLTGDDPLTALIERLVQEMPGMSDLEVQKEA